MSIKWNHRGGLGQGLIQSLPPEITCPDCLAANPAKVNGVVYPASLKGHSKSDRTATYQCKKAHITIKLIGQLHNEFDIKDRKHFMMDGTQVAETS